MGETGPGRFPAVLKPAAPARVGRRRRGSYAGVPAPAPRRLQGSGGPGAAETRAEEGLAPGSTRADVPFLVGNRAPGAVPVCFTNTLSLQEFSLGKPEAVGGWSHRTSVGAGPQHCGPRAPAGQGAGPARPGLPCSLRPAPRRPQPALHLGGFPLTAWRPQGLPPPAVGGEGSWPGARVREPDRTWTASELARRARAKNTLDAPSPACRKGQATSQRTTGLLPNAWSPEPGGVGTAPRNKALIMRVHELHRRFQKDRPTFNPLGFLVGIIKVGRKR